MSTVLIKNVRHAGLTTDVLIENNRFKSIGKPVAAADTVVDGTGMAILPPFYNAHCHAAMTLLRGYADDMDLFTWLSKHIWPMEAKLDADDVYNGARLAILEMIKSGTVFFADTYWFLSSTIRAAEEMGVRANIGLLELDNGNGDAALEIEKKNAAVYERRGELSSRIQLSLAPHAIYTCSTRVLERCAERSAERGMLVHIHLSETAKEVADCRAAHGGLTPVEYLDSLGLVNDKLLAAHCVHLTDSDIELMSVRRAAIAHNPVSNMKLASGAFRYCDVMKAKCRVALGTDGVSSNNNLSMIEEMKFASLLAKVTAGDPTAAPAQEVFDMATRNGAQVFGLDGEIAEGRLADCILVRLADSRMVSDYNVISNMVYSADSNCVDTVICDGRILMRNREVAGEQEIIARAQRCVEKLKKL